MELKPSFINILIVFITYQTTRVEAIRCYECTSFPGSSCGENFRPNHVDLVDCMANYFDTYNTPRMCKKKISKTSDGIVIHRGCLTRRELQELDEVSDEMCVPLPYNQDIVCRCDTDRCNSAKSHLEIINLCFVSFISFVLILFVI